MKNILVTGGCGYIGSQTAIALIEAGYNVIIFDKADANPILQKTFSTFNDKIKIVKGNLLNKAELNNLFATNQIDGIIHFAASIEVGESQINPALYYENNVIGSFNLINTANSNNVKKIVFSSTAAVYGIPESVPILETSRINPINTYGYTKLVIEQMLRDFGRSYGLDSVCLRYFNACGADKLARTGENHNPETHLIPSILQSIGTDKIFKIFGDDYNTPDGTCVRDYIHTTDLASAHILALEKLLNGSGIVKSINLGTGAGYSNKQVFDTVEKITGHKINMEIGARRDGDPDQLVADNTLAKEYLSWNPVNSDLENIISTAWNWEQNKKNYTVK
jgi:UDP-glucose 4-epimerase